MRLGVRITGVSTRVVGAGHRDWVFLRVETDEPVEEVAAAHPDRSSRPHLQLAPDGGLLDW